MRQNLTSIVEEVGQCPACEAPLTMAIQISFETISVTDGSASASGRVTGAKTIEHNCIPRVTR